MEFIEATDQLELKRCWSLVRSRWKLILGSSLSCIGLATILVSQQKPIYQASGRLLIRSEQTASMTGLDINLGELHSLGAYQKDPLDTQLQVLRSAPVVESVIHQLDLRDDNNRSWTSTAFLQQLNTEVIRGTDVLQVSFESEEPELALTIVNALIRAYIDNNVVTNRQEAISARLFIEQQLPESEEAVRLAEEQLSQFKYEHSIITLEEESTQAIQVIAQLDRQREEAQTQLADVQAQVEQLQSRIGLDAAQALDASILSESAAVQDTLAQIQEVESQLMMEQAQYQRASPSIAQLETQAIKLKQLLQVRVDQALETPNDPPLSRLQVGPTKQELIASFLRLEIEEKGLENRVQNLSMLADQYRGRAESLPLLEQEQRELKRRLEAAQTTYENLLTKLEEVNAAEKQNVENARVIEAPNSATQLKNSTQTALILGGSGVLGTALGISAAFLLSALHKPVRSIQKAKELLRYELLGIIPAFDQRGQLRDEFYRAQSPRICNRDLSSSIAQGGYRTVLENLLGAASDRKVNTLLVTSTTSGEGKSEVVANLALMLTQQGHKVLLVDANPGAASLHKIWHLPNQTGLTTLLSNEGKIERELQAVHPNLHLLTSGPDSTQTSRLMRSKSMENLVDCFARHYDYVLLDGPSLTETDDACHLGEIASGIFFVIRPAQTSIDSVLAAQQGLQYLRQNILGMVINGVDIRVEPINQLGTHSRNQRRSYQLITP